MAASIRFVLSLLASITLVSATIGFGDCPACLPIAIHDAPGIGFDLTAGYGVSSVNIYNGSTRDLVKVDASQEYKDLFVRLSSAPKPQHTFITSLQRWLNKKRGLPSTKDVGILSELITQLKTATEAELGLTLNDTKIVLANPSFTALTAEDLGDAIEYSGLKSWLHVPDPEFTSPPNQLSSNRAALAAHGVNLCQEVGSYQCCVEGLSIEGPGIAKVYFVSLSHSALYTSFDKYLQPFEGWAGPYERHFFDSKLGLDSMKDFASNESYWAAVRDKLVPPDVKRPVTHVIVGGEATMMPEFRTALQDALALGNVTFRDGLNSTMERAMTGRISPLYSAARGAALLARWRQEAPMECWEREDCATRRKHEREGTAYSPRESGEPYWDFSSQLENEEYQKYYEETLREKGAYEVENGDLMEGHDEM